MLRSKDITDHKQHTPNNFRSEVQKSVQAISQLRFEPQGSSAERASDKAPMIFTKPTFKIQVFNQTAQSKKYLRKQSKPGHKKTELDSTKFVVTGNSSSNDLI